MARCQSYDLGDPDHKFGKHEFHDVDFTKCGSGLALAKSKVRLAVLSLPPPQPLPLKPL